MFALGSLLYPKHLSFMMQQSRQTNPRGISLNLISNFLTHSRIQRIHSIQDYLYKFSLERLKNFASDPILLTLFRYYFDRFLPERVNQSATLIKNKDSYINASEKIINFAENSIKVSQKGRIQPFSIQTNHTKPTLKLLDHEIPGSILLPQGSSNFKIY